MKSQPTMYIINSNAIGDTVSALPIVKKLIETYHKTEDYGVIGLPQFRDLFYFIDDNHFHDIDKPLSLDKNYILVKLNILEQDKTAYLMLPGQPTTTIDLKGQYLNPLRIHLSKYAGLQLSGRIFETKDCSYLKYPIDSYIEAQVIEKFNIDFSKCVLFNTSYRDNNRALSSNVVNEVSKYLNSVGLTPLFVGKSETPDFVSDHPYKKSSYDTSLGIDLRDKTTIKELIYIMNNSRAIIGIDNGLIHLAAMTDLPIIAAYTVVSPKVRAPIRYGKLGGGCEIIEASDKCRYCEDSWQLDHHDYATCFYNTNECCNSLTAEMFIDAFNRIS
jgi:hypothetical protein